MLSGRGSVWFRALGSGPRGRRFESSRPDHFPFFLLLSGLLALQYLSYRASLRNGATVPAGEFQPNVQQGIQQMRSMVHGMRPTGRLALLPLFLPVVMGGAVLLCSARLCPAAVNEFDYDQDLVKALVEIQEPKLKDFARLQIDLMLGRYQVREQQELITLEQARIYFMNGSPEGAQQALQLLAKIPVSSPNFAAVCLLKGDMYSRRRDYADSDKAFAEYFKRFPKPGASPREQKDFEGAVKLSAAVATEMGDPDRVAVILERLGMIQSADEESARRIKMYQVFGMLAAVEQAVQFKKPVNKLALEKAKKIAADVIWKAGESDQYVALAYVEQAHAEVLLGNFAAAIKVLNDSAGLMKMLEEQMVKDESGLGNSPKAGALYYLALARAGTARALKGSNAAEAKTQAQGVIKLFDGIRKKYGQSKYWALSSIASSRLWDEFGLAGAGSRKDPDAEMEAKLQEARPFLDAKKYAEAQKYVLAALRAGLGGAELPRAGASLLECYGASGESLQGEALAAYLAEAYPQHPETTDALRRYIVTVEDSARNTPKGELKEARTDIAMRVQMTYISIAPKNDSAAPLVAFSLAEKMYARANEVRLQAQPLEKGREKDELLLKAREKYLAAAPFYQRVVDLFPDHANAIAACNKLAWILYSAEHYKEAAPAFDRYVAIETDLEGQCYARLQAIYRAAESYMLAGDAEAALDRFPKVLKEMDSEIAKRFVAGLLANVDPKKKIQGQKLTEFRDYATAYIAWSYDIWAARLRTDMTQVDKRKEDLAATEQAAGDRVKAAGQVLADAETKVRQTTEEFAAFKSRLYMVPGAADAERKAKEWEQIGGMTKAEIAVKCAEILANSSAGWKTQLGGEAGELLLAQKELKADALKAADERARTAAAQAKLEGELNGIKGSLAAKKSQIDALMARAKDATNAYEAAAAAYKKTAELLEKAKRITKTKPAQPNPNWDAWLKIRQDCAEKVQADKAAMDEAAKSREAAFTDAMKTQLKATQDAIVQLEARQVEIAPELPARQEAAELAAKVEAMAAARLAANVAAVKRNARQAELAAAKPASEVMADPSCKALLDAELEAQQKVQADRLAFEETRRAFAVHNRDAATAELAKIREQVAATEAERGPRLAEIEAKKKLAKESMAAYLKEFPNGKLAADAMARLGTLALEFKEFDAAAKLFGELKKRFPESKAAKMGAFNMGRANVETGQTAKAAAAFAKALAQADDLSLFNLKYIADAMLDKDANSAFAAAAEIVKRGEDDKSPDYARASRKGLREPMLILAAKAAVGKGDPGAALALTAKLLAENENTAFFFEAKFVQSAAYCAKTPPAYPQALDRLGEILNQQPVADLETRALLEVAVICSAQGGVENQKKALSACQQVLLNDPNQNAVVLANWEKAAEEGVKLCVTLGDKGKCEKIIAAYRMKMPKGKALRGFEATLVTLPDAPVKKAAPGAGVK